MVDVAKRYLSTREIYEMLGYTRRGFRKMVATGQFPPASIKTGKQGQRWRAGLVEDWLREQERRAQAKGGAS